MFTTNITTRFTDTDALGHINNNAIPVWFEEARNAVFEIFIPDLDIQKWNLILVKIEVEFLKQLYYGIPVEIRTYIHKIGNSSFQVEQEAWQNDEMSVRGVATLVHFDYQTNKSVIIPDHYREQLSAHMKPE